VRSIGNYTVPDVHESAYEFAKRLAWLRLFGRHHTRAYYTRDWNDEPWTDRPWLEGHDCIDRLLATRPADRGAEIIPDPPIHSTREAVSAVLALAIDDTCKVLGEVL
jgi:hypothetical protein